MGGGDSSQRKRTLVEERGEIIKKILGMFDTMKHTSRCPVAEYIVGVNMQVSLQSTVAINLIVQVQVTQQYSFELRTCTLCALKSVHNPSRRVSRTYDNF